MELSSSSEARTRVVPAGCAVPCNHRSISSLTATTALRARPAGRCTGNRNALSHLWSVRELLPTYAAISFQEFKNPRSAILPVLGFECSSPPLALENGIWIERPITPHSRRYSLIRNDSFRHARVLLWLHQQPSSHRGTRLLQCTPRSVVLRVISSFNCNVPPVWILLTSPRNTRLLLAELQRDERLQRRVFKSLCNKPLRRELLRKLSKEPKARAILIAVLATEPGLQRRFLKILET
jgi:hypothetical protein